MIKMCYNTAQKKAGTLQDSRILLLCLETFQQILATFIKKPHRHMKLFDRNLCNIQRFIVICSKLKNREQHGGQWQY